MNGLGTGRRVPRGKVGALRKPEQVSFCFCAVGLVPVTGTPDLTPERPGDSDSHPVAQTGKLRQGRSMHGNGWCLPCAGPLLSLCHAPYHLIRDKPGVREQYGAKDQWRSENSGTDRNRRTDSSALEQGGKFGHKSQLPHYWLWVVALATSRSKLQEGGGDSVPRLAGVTVPHPSPPGFLASAVPALRHAASPSGEPICKEGCGWAGTPSPGQDHQWGGCHRWHQVDAELLFHTGGQRVWAQGWAGPGSWAASAPSKGSDFGLVVSTH